MGSSPTERQFAARVAAAIAPYGEALTTGFAEHVASVVATGGDEHAVALDDLALAFAAARGATCAIVIIEREVIEPLPRTLARLRPTPELVEDLRQELREKLLVGGEGRAPRLLEYRARGALGAWARIIALRAAYDRMRARSPESVASDDEALANIVDASDTPELAQLRATYAGELRAAFHAAARRLSHEQRAVLRAHVVDGLTIDQIGALYQVHRATAARWVQQAKAALLDFVRDEIAGRFGSRDDCESIVALVRSRIDLSIARVLGPDEQARR